MRYLLLIIGLLGHLALSAQFNDDRHHHDHDHDNEQRGLINRSDYTPTLSVGAQAAVPTGRFAEDYQSNPAGVNAALTLPLGDRIPIEMGLGFAWNQLGSEHSGIHLEDDPGEYYEGDMSVFSNNYAWHGVARLRPFNGAFRPYGDVMAGFRTFSTKTKLYSEALTDSRSPMSKEVVERDISWATGWAVGLQLRLTEGLFLEGRYENWQGSEVEFVDPESIFIGPEGELNYTKRESKISQYAFSVGLALNF